MNFTIDRRFVPSMRNESDLACTPILAPPTRFDEQTAHAPHAGGLPRSPTKKHHKPTSRNENARRKWPAAGIHVPMVFARLVAVFASASVFLSLPACGDELASGTGGGSGTDSGVTPTGPDASATIAGDVTTSGGSESAADTESSGDIEDPSFIFDVLYVPDVGAGTICNQFPIEAETRKVPTDLIIVVDGSGSMVEEAAGVEAQLNQAVARIVREGVDVRVVLLARSQGSTQICIDAPVGSGACPGDSNEPGFRHVDADIGSWEPLRALVDFYPQYADLLRPEARLQLVVVSDDNSFDMSAADFEVDFEALDPWNEGFVFHALATQSSCPAGVSPGTEYETLVGRTGGWMGDLCSQDFEGLFDRLAGGTVEASEACVYPLGRIAEWPDNASAASMALDGMPLAALDAVDGCGVGGQGWFLDDPEAPTAIRLCPSSCELVRESEQPALNVDVTCDFNAG